MDLAFRGDGGGRKMASFGEPVQQEEGVELSPGQNGETYRERGRIEREQQALSVRTSHAAELASGVH